MIDEKKLIADMEKLPFIHGRYDKKNANPHFISGVESMYEMIKELIKSQPKVGEWIPCSERLPGEEAEQYIRDVYNGKGSLYPCLVTYKIPNHERICIGEFYYDIDEKCFINHEGRKETNCLAWMPLPEPWKGEK